MSELLKAMGVTGQLAVVVLALLTLVGFARAIIIGWKEFLATIREVAVKAVDEHVSACPARVDEERWKREVGDRFSEMKAALDALHRRIDAVLQHRKDGLPD